jgi:hypothetical protein
MNSPGNFLSQSCRQLTIFSCTEKLNAATIAKEESSKELECVKQALRVAVATHETNAKVQQQIFVFLNAPLISI